MKRVAKSLLNSPRKKQFVIAKMAKEVGLKVKGIHQKVCTGISPKQIDDVQNFFEKNEISWQAPGRKDRVISQEVLSNGKTSKKATQVQYMLMSLKEAYHQFQEEMKDEVTGLSKFSSLRPTHIKLLGQIPHNMCVCEYHENICLILSVLENHTSLSSKFDDFVQQVTCDQTCKDCIYQHCDNCRDLLETFKSMPDEGALLTKCHQWQTCDKKTEKIFITATVDAIFDDLRSQLNGFLVP